jgi:hypothetical protein
MADEPADGETAHLAQQYRIEHFVVGAVKMDTVGMISQRLMAHPASHSVASVVSHQEPNAVLVRGTRL